MKKIEELKEGMKVWIPFKIEKINNYVHYPFRLRNEGFTFSATKDCKVYADKPNLEIYEEEKIPTLTPVEIEVSYDNKTWETKNIVGRFKEKYMDETGCLYNYARFIQKTVTLEIPESELTDKLRKYLKK